MPIQMDVYDQQSYEYSISNLATLKLFYEAGVDLTHYSTMMVSVHGDMSLPFDICFDGLNKLYSEVTYFDYSDIEKSEFKYLAEEQVPDTTIIIRDEVFKSVLTSQMAEQFTSLVNSIDGGFNHYSEGEFTVLNDNSGIALLVWCSGLYHEYVEAVLTFQKTAEQFIKQLEGENKHGNHSETKRQFA